MVSIAARGKTYQYTVSNMVNGKSKPIRKGGFKTKREAKTAGLKVEYNLRSGINPIQKDELFSDYFEKWVSIYKEPKISKVTLAHYKYSLSALQEYFQYKPIQKIQREDYQKFLNWLGNMKAKETVSKINGHIKACVDDAVEDQVIHKDFTKNTKIVWTVDSKPASEKYLDYHEAKLLTEAIWKNVNNGLGYSILLLAITTGMRFEENIGLTRNDFDFENNKITINKTWGYKAKSPKGFGPTKNKQSNRVINMDQKTMDHFNKLFKSSPTTPYDLVFYSSRSKYNVISNTNTNQLLAKLLKQLKLKHITIHGLRHTHGSMLLHDKVRIDFVRQRLGHSDIETTLKIYTHLLKESQIEQEDLTKKMLEKLNL